MLRNTILAIAGLLLLAHAAPAEQNIVRNGSMESGDGPGAIDPRIPDGWTTFGINIERSGTVNFAPSDGAWSLKSFGDADNNAAGAFQEIADVSPGQSVTASAQLFSPANDKLGGSGQAGLVLEFLDIFGGTLSLQQVYPFDAASPADTWVPATIGPLTAPSGTAKVRVTCRLQWSPGNVFGAVYWDDVQVSIDGGPNAVVNGDFEVAGHSPGQSPNGIDEWTGFGDQEKSQDVAEDGASSLKFGTREAYSGLFQNMGALNAGDHIYMLAWAWNPSSDPLTDNTRVGIKLEFDANGDVPPPEENLAFDESVPANQWTQVQLNTVVPPDVTIARIVCIYVGDPQTTGAVHFDAVSAERGSVPGVNQLANESFEAGPGGANGLTDWTEFGSPGVAEAQKSCFEVPAQDGICTARAWGESVAGLFQEITVTPGETLDLSAWLYTPDFEPLTGSGRAGLKVEWAVGGVPDDIDIGGATNTLDASAPTDTWLPIYIDYTMPAGSSALARYTCIIEKGTALSGTVYLDSCEAVVLNRYDGADVDGDDDEDMIDFAAFQRAYTGAGAATLPFNGLTFDHDADQDVDLDDWGFFWPRITGPAQ